MASKFLHCINTRWCITLRNQFGRVYCKPYVGPSPQEHEHLQVLLILLTLKLLPPWDLEQQLISMTSFHLEVAPYPKLTSSCSSIDGPYAMPFLLRSLLSSRKPILFFLDGVNLYTGSFLTFHLYLEEVQPSTRCCANKILAVLT